MCWKMEHVGRRQGKCWRLNVGQNRIMFVSSGDTVQEVRGNDCQQSNASEFIWE